MTEQEYNELAFDPRQYDEHEDERDGSVTYKVIKKGGHYEWDTQRG